MVVYIRPNSSFVKSFILLELRGILQECGDFTWRGCLTVKNLWELLTGDDGVDGENLLGV